MTGRTPQSLPSQGILAPSPQSLDLDPERRELVSLGPPLATCALPARLPGLIRIGISEAAEHFTPEMNTQLSSRLVQRTPDAQSGFGHDVGINLCRGYILMT